jgi:hypothetical protein
MEAGSRVTKTWQLPSSPRRAHSSWALVAFVAALAGVGVLVGANAAVGASSRPNPKLLVLTLGDLPETVTGFERSRAYVDDNARAARDTGRTVAEVVALGRITGYYASFDEKRELVGPGSRILVGISVHHVESQANVYRSAALARASFRAQLSEPLPRGVRAVKPKTRLGDEMIVVTQVAPHPYLPGASDDVFFVYWRSGPVTASVLVAGLAEIVGLNDAMALARKQQQKLVQALR